MQMDTTIFNNKLSSIYPNSSHFWCKTMRESTVQFLRHAFKLGKTKSLTPINLVPNVR